MDNELISEYLKDLTLLKGIEGIAIFSHDNSILDAWHEPNFNPKLFEEISINYFQMFSILDSGYRDFHEVVTSHEKGKVYVRVLPDLLLVVVAKSNIEMALVRLVVNVQIVELLNSRKLQKLVKKISEKSSNFLNKKYLDQKEDEYLKKIKS
jgi:hypothetical protein